MWTFLLYLGLEFYWPVHCQELSSIWLTMGLNTYQTASTLRGLVGVGWIPSQGMHRRPPIDTFISHHCLSPLSQISRI